MVMEVGSPSGWGPVGMSAERLKQVVTRIRGVAEKHHAQVTQVGGVGEKMRQGTAAEVASEGYP